MIEENTTQTLANEDDNLNIESNNLNNDINNISTFLIIKELIIGRKTDSNLNRFFNVLISSFFILILIFLFLSLIFKWHYITYNKEHYFKNRSYEVVVDASTGKGDYKWTGPKPEQDPYYSDTVGGGIGLDKYIRELDIAGLLGGFIGIFIGLILAVILEKQNRRKQIQTDYEMNELKNTVAKLDSTSTKIDNSVNKIDNRILNVVDELTKLVERENSFFPTDTLEKVLDKIDEIIIQSFTDSTDLLIMNHSTSFGYILSFKLKTVLSSIKGYKLEEIENITFKEYHKAFEEINFNLNKVFRNLRERGEGIVKAGNNVVFIVLSPDSQTPTYQKNYLDQIMEGTEIILYDEYSNEKLSFLEGKSPVELEKYYFIPKSIIQNKESTPEANKANFIQHLVDKQRREIMALRAEGIDVKEVKEIPIQVYLSDLRNGKGTCLFMFVNHQTIGKSGHNLVAFASKNEPYILNSFKSIVEQTN